MNLSMSIAILVFALLSFILKIVVASPTKQHTIRSNKSANQISTNKSPYWEYILREFVFKTISSPPQSSDILYKKLLDAPFYGGPLPTPSNEDNVLLSRGNVYHLSDGQWILCQNNCNDCTPCINQKNSIVEWTLRKVKRLISANSHKYDLELTMVPHLRYGALKDFQARNYVYIRNDSIVSSEATSTTETSHIDRSRSRTRMQRDDREQKNQYDDFYRNSSSMNASSKFFTTPNIQRNISEFEYFVPTSRLIMGIDQSARKHVIHIMSMGSSEQSDVNHIRMDNGRKNDTPNENINGASYQQYINKLLESINSYRPIIEAFLSYNRTKIDHSTAQFSPVYSEYVDNNDKKLNFDFETHNNNNPPPDWSKILTRIPRDKNYIPKLMKKFNGNVTNIIQSRSIGLFQL